MPRGRLHTAYCMFIFAVIFMFIGMRKQAVMNAVCLEWGRR